MIKAKTDGHALIDFPGHAFWPTQERYSTKNNKMQRSFRLWLWKRSGLALIKGWTFQVKAVSVSSADKHEFSHAKKEDTIRDEWRTGQSQTKEQLKSGKTELGLLKGIISANCRQSSGVFEKMHFEGCCWQQKSNQHLICIVKFCFTETAFNKLYLRSVDCVLFTFYSEIWAAHINRVDYLQTTPAPP